MFFKLQQDNALLLSLLRDVETKYERHAKDLEKAEEQLKEKESEREALLSSLRLLEEGIEVQNGQLRFTRRTGYESPLSSKDPSSASLIKSETLSFFPEPGLTSN